MFLCCGALGCASAGSRSEGEALGLFGGVIDDVLTNQQQLPFIKIRLF